MTAASRLCSAGAGTLCSDLHTRPDVVFLAGHPFARVMAMGMGVVVMVRVSSHVECFVLRWDSTERSVVVLDSGDACCMAVYVCNKRE